MVCLLDTAAFSSARAKHSVVSNSVMEHAPTGKKPKKMAVSLDTRNGLLQDLYNGKKERESPLCCENYL